MIASEANVAAVMTEAPLTVEPDDPLAAAARTMERHAIRHLPVVADGALVGLLSQRDLLAAADGDRLVRDVMSEECMVTHPGASAAEAARALLTFKIGCLPVVDEGALVGIVTESDFVRVAYAVLAAVSASVARPRHEARVRAAATKAKAARKHARARGRARGHS